MLLAAGPFGLGPMELVIILLVLVMVFGASRLSELGGSLGKGIKEFRKSIKDDDEAEAPQPPAPLSTSLEDGPQTVSAIKCPNCGTLNPVGAKHCNQCGTALTAPVT
jgi:sec-independent protein translocase protein TatA